MRLSGTRRQSHDTASQLAFARIGTALAAVSVGVLAAGAVAIGSLAIRRLALKDARIGRLRVEEIEVKRLRVGEVLRTDEPRDPGVR